MASVLVPLCLTAFLAVVTAEQSNYASVQSSQFATPGSQGIKYAGPIVYTNEKPPVIHFPPPPTPGQGGYLGTGQFGKGQSVKYIPLPHHDLPVLIYQSDISPPIHVVHPQQGQQQQQPGFGQLHQPGLGQQQPGLGQLQQPGLGQQKTHVQSPSTPKSQKSEYSSIRGDYSSQHYSYRSPPSYRSTSSYRSKPQTQKSQYDTSADYSTQSKTVYKPSPRPSPRPSQRPSQRPYSHTQQYSSSPPKYYTYTAQPKQKQQSSTPTKSYGSGEGSYEYTSQSKNRYRTSRPPPKYRYPFDLFGSGSSPVSSFSSSEYIPQKPKYEQVKKSTPAPLPHIIYAGHPPIHVFQQPPIYMAAPKASKTPYTSSKSTYSSSKQPDYLYTSESSPPRSVYGDPKPTFRPSSKPKVEYYRTSSKPKVEYYRTSSKPKVEYYRTSSRPQYRQSSPTSKTEYSRQKADYSSPAAVYVKPEKDFDYLSSSSTSSLSSYRPIKSDAFRSSKIWGSGFSTGVFSSPIKYKTHRQVTYSPAPKNWHKPPIIIYQGVKPPVHMFENVVSFSSVDTSGGLGGVPSNFATRRISSHGASIDPRSNVGNDYQNSGTNPTMWIPAYGMQTENGYQTTLYVSDLTQAGTSPNPVTPTTAPTLSSEPATPDENQTVQVPTPEDDGSTTTTQETSTQVTNSASQVDEVAVTESPANTADKTTSSADDRIDSLPTTFLASGVNNQNSALSSIPMSYASVFVQTAGSQPHRVIY